MNQEIKNKWLEALRSGEYEQAQEKLRDGNNPKAYCCLGVLCDLYAKERLGMWNEVKTEYRSIFEFNTRNTKSAKVLPDDVISWAGLQSSDPYISGKGSLSEMNDTDIGFKDIAKVIKENL